jgi:hypothetical protein
MEMMIAQAHHRTGQACQALGEATPYATPHAVFLHSRLNTDELAPSVAVSSMMLHGVSSGKGAKRAVHSSHEFSPARGTGSDR